jgi:hypothetical protein
VSEHVDIGTAFATEGRVPILTVSRAVVALRGVSPSDLGGPELSPAATQALTPLLESHGFDVTRPIQVLELSDYQGFRLTQ